MPSPAQHELEAEDGEKAILMNSLRPQEAPTQRPAARRACATLAAGAAAAALATAGALAVRRLGSQATSSTADARVVLLSEECSASAQDGQDCGFQGITQDECEAKGCCYDDTNWQWCWGSGGGGQEWECRPDAAEGDGGNCGFQGITQDACEAEGCCYDESNPNNWCFPKTLVGPGGGAPAGGGGGGEPGGPAGGGPSLFCFAVACSGEENAVLDLQQSKNSGIFACEEWKKVDGQTSARGGGLTRSWTNVDTFIAAWRSVEGDARWKNSDWTVKADPDTVWVPQRLRDWLGGQGDVGNGAFVSNCMGVDNGFYGALEVMSRGAVDTYIREIDNCQGELQGKEGMGEDLFAQWCMQSKGVQEIGSGDLICNTDCGCDPRPCDTGRIAYHPFKEVDDHANCISQL